MMELDPTQDDNRFVPAGPLRPPPAEAAGPFSEHAVVDPAEHNIVFTSLVTSDKDIIGLVAYSIYKQNKYDWLMAFSRQQGRMPNQDEAQSYLFGESTARRLATYRHLAEAMLDGKGLDVPGAASRPSPASRNPLGTRVDAATHGGGVQASRSMLIGVILLILIVIGVIWFFHGGPAPSGK